MGWILFILLLVYVGYRVGAAKVIAEAIDEIRKGKK